MTDRELNKIIDWCRKKLANEKRNPCGLTGKRMDGYEQAMKVVMSYLHSMKGGEAHSTADVVQVVRCKDCTVPHNQWTGCPILNGLVTPPDFYCGYGERRKEDDKKS